MDTRDAVIARADKYLEDSPKGTRASLLIRDLLALLRAPQEPGWRDYVQHRAGCAVYPWPTDEDWRRIREAPIGPARQAVAEEIDAKPRPACTCGLAELLALPQAQETTP